MVGNRKQIGPHDVHLGLPLVPIMTNRPPMDEVFVMEVSCLNQIAIVKLVTVPKEPKAALLVTCAIGPLIPPVTLTADERFREWPWF